MIVEKDHKPEAIGPVHCHHDNNPSMLGFQLPSQAGRVLGREYSNKAVCDCANVCSLADVADGKAASP
jgi:hypothetical protein